MIAFIIDKRRFKDFDKKPELVFIFDNELLFDKLSGNYKCVNLNKKGIITKENFFPKTSLQSKSLYFEIKRGVYAYFKKKHYNALRSYMVMRGGYKDTIYNFIISSARKLENQKQYEEADKILNMGIINSLKEILDLEGIKEDKYFNYLMNYSYSFYRSYIFSFAKKRGIDVLGDIFRFNLILNIMKFYKYDKFDTLSDGFKTGYLRVISRLFIEQIHKNDVKNFVKKNIEYYKNMKIY